MYIRGDDSAAGVDDYVAMARLQVAVERQ